MPPPLLQVTGTLAPIDAKTVRSFPFDVPAGTEAMALVVEWSPHACDDPERNRDTISAGLSTWGGPSRDDRDPFLHAEVQRCLQRLPTLLNTVLVEPSGRWRGRSDRGKGTREAPLVVDPDNPGPGFVRGPLTPGRWSLDLEIHSCVTETCTFFLEVTAIPRPQPEAHSSGSPQCVERNHGGPGWYRGDLHTHTRHSDGSHDVAELLRRAESLGLDFIALTDHNTTSGAAELLLSSFPTILGAELTTFRGHHVCLGLDEMVPWHQSGRVLDVNEVAGQVRRRGALFTLTHPFNLGDPICTGGRWMTPELSRAHIDLVEVWHRRWIGGSADNPAALALWDELWRAGHRPTAVAVRDWHNKGHEAALPGPLPTTVVRAHSRTQKDLLEGLRRGAVILTRGPHLEPHLLAAGQTLLALGDKGTKASGPVTLRVDVDMRGIDEVARLELFRNGERRAAVDVHASGRYHLVDDGGGAGWWRAQLIGADDAPLAITNHIELV
jgi:hypothetical protein